MDQVIVAALGLEDVSLEQLENQGISDLPPDPAAPERKRQFLGGRLAARHLFEELSLPSQITVDPELGFLRVARGHLSLSHTEGLALAAWSPKPVGIDVEVLERDASKVIPRFSSARELEWARHSSHQNPHLALWVLKEAVSKACGLGMSQGMTTFQISQVGEERFRSPVPENAPFPMNQAEMIWVPWEEHLIALCTEAELLSHGGVRVLRVQVGK